MEAVAVTPQRRSRIVRPPVEQQYFGPGEAATYLGFSTQHLANLRLQGRGPRFFRPNGGHVRYAREDLDAWARGNPSGGEQPQAAAEGA